MKLLVVSGGNHPYVESTPVLMEFLQDAGHEATLTEEAGLLAADRLFDCDVLVFNTLRRQETALAEAEPDRIQVIDANRPLENVQADIMSAVSAALKNANSR